MKNRMFAFVLMPFSPDFEDIYQLGIKAAADDVGVIAERVDEQIYSEMVLERIYHQIDEADFIIAEMTGKNANVFYEVGYAHARKKTCILITQEARDIPFDLKHHRHLIYKNSITTLKEMLIREITWVEENIIKQKTSSITISLQNAYGLLEKGLLFSEGKVFFTLDIKNDTVFRSSDIEAIYLYTNDRWRFIQDGSPCPSISGESQGFSKKHFIKSPVQRLSPNGWAPLNLIGSKYLEMRKDNVEIDKSRTVHDEILFEIITTEKILENKIILNVECHIDIFG